MPYPCVTMSELSHDLRLEPSGIATTDSSSGHPEPDEHAIAGEDAILSLMRTIPPRFNWQFLLRIEAFSLVLAYSHNKIMSLSNSRTRILSHQVSCAHRVMSSLNKRFLIADEVGLGKTIEAGLVIKELEYRHRYRRVLIICPASLQYQWQREMQSKFNDRYVIMDRRELNRLSNSRRGANPWEAHERVICSIDFMKNRRLLKSLGSISWDAVIFDEAHRLRRDGRRATLAYEAAEAIAGRTKALLLLTATPFRGNLEELYFLIALLDPHILGPFHSYFNDYCLDNSELATLRDAISPVVIRRTKREVGGFTRRCARTVRFELYPDERRLYDETTLYVAEEFNRALQNENRAVGFVMTVFQKLLDSSTHALGCALERRMARLEDLLARADLVRRLDIDPGGDTDLIDDIEDLEDLVALSSAKSIAEMRMEIETLRRLVGMSRLIRVNKKAEKLKSLIVTLKKQGHGKVLIFTQFRTTQDYLKGYLSGFEVEVFHGSQGRDEKERAIARFRDEAEILISTEAGGEGRNMQFCNILVNYDLPWSPLKIEQRIGRLHRFGQPHDVFIYNFSTRNTVAERVLEILNQKLRLFEESIGAPDVLLGQIEDELRLNSLLMEMAAGIRSTKSMKREAERRIELARSGYEKISELTVTDRIDFNYDEYYRVTLKERKFTNRRIERFVNTLTRVDDGAALSITPGGARGLYRVAAGDGNGDKLGTFDSAIALEDEGIEFLAFGHPAVDRLVARCRDSSFGGFTGVESLASDIPFSGMVFYFLVTFTSVTEVRELVPVVAILDPVFPIDRLGSIEDELVDRERLDAVLADDTRVRMITARADEYWALARRRIRMKIEERRASLRSDLDLGVDPEIEKILASYRRKGEELEEKLELQEAQYKWYGRNLKGTITRTKNLIEKNLIERDMVLDKTRGHLVIGHSTELLCAGVILSRPA